MKKRIFISMLLILFRCGLEAQSGTWTWMKGDTEIYSLGNWGTQGIPDSLNNPPALFGTVPWTSSDGKFWMFGGRCDCNSGNYYSALWRFDPTTKTWTWVNGPNSSGAHGFYGVKGVASSNNFPAGRTEAFSWIDASDNLWMYGGSGADSPGVKLLSDMWRYNINTNEWVWISGDSVGNALVVYDSYQIASTSNNPGAREDGSSWIDDAGNLWLYGGGIHSLNCCNTANDVWKFDPVSGEWAWMKGDDNSYLSEEYGGLNQFDPSFTPGSRLTYAFWKQTNNQFYFFGGYYLWGVIADVWRYDANINEWARVSAAPWWSAGSCTYGTLCNADTSTYPCATFGNTTCWTDRCDNFYMFGGATEDNTLWFCDNVTNYWSRIHGPYLGNTCCSFGIRGVPDSSNHPGGVGLGASWFDKKGNLWMFGGQTSITSPGYFYPRNVMWKYVPDTTCQGCKITDYVASSTHICEKFCVDFIDPSPDYPTSWLWQFPGGTPSSSTDQNPANICYNEPGIYDVTLITTNANGSDTLTLHNYINIYPTPAIPTITQVGYTLTSSEADFYQWQLNAVDIPGATNQSYDVLQTGFYTVVVSDSNGCVNSATQYVEITGIDEVNDANVSVYPNPSSGSFTVQLLHYPVGDAISIKVVNTVGQIIFTDEEKINSDIWKNEIDLCSEATSCVAEGIYFLEIKTGNNFVKKKIIITK